MLLWIADDWRVSKGVYRKEYYNGIKFKSSKK